VAEAPGCLKPGGKLMLEIGFGQAGLVRDLILAEQGLEFEKTIPDFAGIDRVIVAVRR